MVALRGRGGQSGEKDTWHLRLELGDEIVGNAITSVQKDYLLMENTRVSELAKDLGMTSKEVIEKFAEIDIAVKSHSNVVTPQQIRRSS